MNTGASMLWDRNEQSKTRIFMDTQDLLTFLIFCICPLDPLPNLLFTSPPPSLSLLIALGGSGDDSLCRSLGGGRVPTNKSHSTRRLPLGTPPNPDPFRPKRLGVGHLFCPLPFSVTPSSRRAHTR